MAQRKKFLRKTQTKKLLKNYCKNSNKLPYQIITQGKLQRLNKRPGKTSENEQGLASFKHRYPVEKFGIIWKLGLGIWKLRGFIWCCWFFMFKKKLCGSNLVSTNLQWKKNTVFPLISTRNAYLISKLHVAALIRGQHLKEGKS